MKRLVSACFERLGGLVLVSVLGACSSTGDTLKETRDFNDSQGRVCQAKLSRTSEHAPALSESVSCDRDAKQCSAEAKPCFSLSTASKEEGYTLRNCPACCSGTASSFVSTDCSPVACSTNEDCVFSLAECQGSVCVCPGGACD